MRETVAGSSEVVMPCAALVACQQTSGREQSVYGTSGGELQQLAAIHWSAWLTRLAKSNQQATTKILLAKCASQQSLCASQRGLSW